MATVPLNLWHNSFEINSEIETLIKQQQPYMYTHSYAIKKVNKQMQSKSIVGILEVKANRAWIWPRYPNITVSKNFEKQCTLNPTDPLLPGAHLP